MEPLLFGKITIRKEGPITRNSAAAMTRNPHARIERTLDALTRNFPDAFTYRSFCTKPDWNFPPNDQGHFVEIETHQGHKEAEVALLLLLGALGFDPQYTETPLLPPKKKTSPFSWPKGFNPIQIFQPRLR